MKFRYLYLLFSIIYLNVDAQQLNNYELKHLIETNTIFSSSFVGVSVLDLKTHKVISSYNGDKNFSPASVLKTIYTLAAVDTKGKDYRYKTKVSYTGEIIFDGTLEGDLIITASGDPALGSPRFYKNGYKSILKLIRESLMKSGITCIEGDIILELTNQSYPIHGSWTTEDTGNYYAGGAWSLNFNDNQYKIKFKLNKTLGNRPNILSISPSIPYLHIENYVKMGKKGTGDNAYIYGLPHDFNREVRGTLPIGKSNFTIKGSIPNPPLTFIRFLSNYLDENDFYFTDFRISKKNIKDKKHLFYIKSPPLLEIAKTCNNWSINLYSESLAKLLCLKSNHPNEYLKEEEIRSSLSKYNINFNNAQIVDGCGLSSMNHISPNNLNKFLDDMVKRLGIFTVLDILPKAGVEGYAKNIAIHNLWIKSGSIQGVLNYAGIFKSKKGDYYAFTIFTNNNNKEQTIKIKKSILKLLQKVITLKIN